MRRAELPEERTRHNEASRAGYPYGGQHAAWDQPQQPQPRQQNDPQSSRSTVGPSKRRVRQQDDQENNAGVKAQQPRGGKPLDVSRGKALYKKYQHVQYNSVTQGTWVDAEVIFVREDGSIMIDLKDGHWFSVDEQRTKFKQGRRKAWAEGTELQYFSVTQGGWTDCKVVEVRGEDQAVQINIKQDYWMKASEQDEKLRLPCLDKMDELIFEAGKLLEGDKADAAAVAEQRYREVLKEEPDHVVAMEGLAVLLRDYHQDLLGAEHMFRSALKENPWLFKSLSDLGDILKVTGRTDEGKKLHKRWKRVRDRLKDLEEE